LDVLFDGKEIKWNGRDIEVLEQSKPSEKDMKGASTVAMEEDGMGAVGKTSEKSGVS